MQKLYFTADTAFVIAVGARVFGQDGDADQQRDAAFLRI